jgi:hypothetical protein
VEDPRSQGRQQRRLEVEVDEAGRLGPLVGAEEVGQRLAAEEREGLPEAGRPSRWIALSARLLEQALEAADVRLSGVDPEQVARRVRLDRISSQQFAQRRDVAVECRERSPRPLLAPK